MGDRQSDALARQIAIATPIATAAALMLTDDSRAQTKAAPAAYHSNQALSDEIDRQNAQHRQPVKTKDNPNNDNYSLFLDPNSTGVIVLGPSSTATNPIISVNTQWEYQNFKVVNVTQNNKTVLPNASIASLQKGLVFPGSVDKDHPLKITVSYAGKFPGSIQARLRSL
jgi:hypothetical protein